MDDPLKTADSFQQQYVLSADGYLPKRPLTFSDRVKALSPFCERFMFFSPAMLYLWGRFEDRILVDFLEQSHKRIEFYYYKFNHALFKGLQSPDGDRDWDHVLWAIELEHWPAFMDHVCSSVLHDNELQLVSRVGYQEFKVIDPLVIDRAVVLPTELPVVTIGSFGVLSNKFTVAFNVSGNPLLSQPTLRFYDADEACKQYATALFADQSLTQLSQKFDSNLQETLRAGTTQPSSGNNS